MFINLVCSGPFECLFFWRTRWSDQSETRDGMPVPSREQLSTFSKLEFTRGYNLLTLNLVRRRALGSERLLAYAGAGAALPFLMSKWHGLTLRQQRAPLSTSLLA
jgi:hypothetical protein